MCMEVNEGVKLLKFCGILGNCFFSGPDCWLHSFIRIAIVPVQVLAQRIKSIVTSSNTVRV